MRLHLHDLVPIDDICYGEWSLIQAVFGDEFFVEDEAGRALKTRRNQRLLDHAKAILKGVHLAGGSSEQLEIGHLRRLADAVTPSDYRNVRNRSVAAAWRHTAWDYADCAGALE